MIRRYLTISAFLLISSFAFSQESDFGMWFNGDLEYKLSKKFDLDFSGSIRTYNKTSEFEQAYIEGGVGYKIWKFLSVATSYRLTTKSEVNGFSYWRYKFFADVNSSVPLGHFSVAGRLRLQRTKLTYVENQDDKLVKYHLRIKLKVAYRPSSSPFKPYIGIEPFIPLSSGSQFDIGKMRYSAGTELYLTKKSSVDIGYILERDFKPVAVNLNVVSLGYKFSF